MASNTTQWDPFREMVNLRDAMDSLVNNALVRPFYGNQGSTTGYLPVDVFEGTDSFVIRASVPGMKPEDLHVSVTGNVLTIEGQIKPAEENARYYTRELWWGNFTRQITLPSTVNTDSVQTDYTNGILTLTLPKKEEAKPKRIEIHANGQKALQGKKQ